MEQIKRGGRALLARRPQTLSKRSAANMLAGKQMNQESANQSDRSDLDTVTRLRAVVSRLSRLLRSTQAATGLTPTQISVLVTVVRLGPIKLGDLAAFEGLNPTMLSRIVAQLGEAGLVRRAPHPDDRRAGLVEATAAGRRLRERIRQERNDALAAQLAGLDEAELDALGAALPTLELLAERLKR
jgi:DNA-binding MarR family transcriptional regulator